MNGVSSIEIQNGRVMELCAELTSKGRVIVVSNRGPIEHKLLPSGKVVARRTSGSTVTALSRMIQNVDFTWVSSAMGEGDRQMSTLSEGHRIKPHLPGVSVSLRYVVTPRKVYHKYYNVFCNPLLWFLQHHTWSSSYTPNIDSAIYDAWENGYKAVNESFVECVSSDAKESDSQPFVIIHDYHLYLLPGMLRQRLPGCKLIHLVHVPWPTTETWQLLPQAMRESICKSMLGNDIVGFECNRDARNFLVSCEDMVPGATVDYVNHSVTYAGREVKVKAYPASVDSSELACIAQSPQTLEYEERLKEICGEKTLVRVDRAEPSKNIVRGFKAYAILLDRHPELRCTIKFLAFLAKPQSHIRQYSRYLEEIDQQVQLVNTTYGNEQWQPIQVFYENNYNQALAGMKLYDVLLVNSVIDGVNLVAKEGPLINKKNGVLVLSDSVGAFEQLKEYVLAVSQADLEGTMQAIYKAVNMSSEEKECMARNLEKSIKSEDVTRWLERQLEDLNGLV